MLRKKKKKKKEMVIDAKPKLCLVHTSPHREVDVEIFLMPL
jgi:hypothetical protein